MRELGREAWDAVAEGRLDGPDGCTYTRGSTRSRRADVDALVAAGSPLVVHDYGGGELTWHDGPDAAARWAALRRDVTTHPFRTPAPRRPPQWHAGLWPTPDAPTLVLLTGHC